MAELTITATSVVKGSGSEVKNLTAGASITAGQVVFVNSSSVAVLSDADSTTLDEVTGIALHAASTGQPLAVLTKGPITIGATVVAGTSYYLTATPGAIGVHGDLGADDRVIRLGYATSTTVIYIDIEDTGVILSA